MEKIKNLYNTTSLTDFYYDTDGRLYYKESVLLSSAHSEFSKIFSDVYNTVNELKNNINAKPASKIMNDTDYSPSKSEVVDNGKQ